MKKLFLFSLLTACLLSFSFDVSGQYRGKKKKKKKSTDKKSEYLQSSEDDKSKIWIGLHVDPRFLSLGVTSIGGGFSGNTLGFGLIGSAGYKLTDNFSVGPKAGLFYQGGRFNDFSSNSDDLILNAWDFSVGAIARYNFWRYCFLHSEVETRTESFATGVITSDNRIELEREASFHYYIGAGIGVKGSRFSFGGYLVYDLSIPNNFGNTFNFIDLPLRLRIGVRYNYF